MNTEPSTTTQLTAQEARDSLDEVLRQELSFEQKARAVLDIGSEYLEADFGYLAMTDEETDYWRPVISTDEPADGLQGTTVDLDKTYCQRTIETDEQIALHDAPNQGWADDPAFQTFGHHCYLGTPLVVDGGQYGTVCFVAEEPRSEPFSDAEMMFAELAARSLGHELHCDQAERKLHNQANLSTVLNRVLRHNLRNRLTVIRGQTRVMADELDSDRNSKAVFESIDRLVEFSDKARQLESLLEETETRQQIDIAALVERVGTEVADTYPEATVVVECKERVPTTIPTSFERALTELVENAAKHTGNSPTVTIRVETVPDDIEIEITDDGAGLPEQEQAVLENEAETPLVHGTGLGLWIAHWIVTSHGGAIEPTVTESGTTMSVTLPRTSEPQAESTTDDELDELTLARDQYHAAFEESNEAMVITDDDGRIIDANSAAKTVYAVGGDGMVGESLEAISPDDFDFDAIWRSFRTDGEIRDSMTFVDGDDERMVEYAGTADIVPGQHLFISRDITDRVQREAELRTKTKAMDKAPIGITISDPSLHDNQMTYANEQFCELTGYDETDVVGRNCRFMQGEGTCPASVRRIRQAISQTEPVSVVLRNYRKDGDPFWNRLNIAPVDDEYGNLVNWVGFQEDVTDRVEREQKLQTVIQHLQNAADSASVPVFRTDEEGVIQQWNTAAETATGHSASEVVGDTVHSLFSHADDQEAVFAKRVERTLAGEPVPDFDLRLETDVGIQMPFFAVPLREDSGEGNGLLAIATDAGSSGERAQQ